MGVPRAVSFYGLLSGPPSEYLSTSRISLTGSARPSSFKPVEAHGYYRAWVRPLPPRAASRLSGLVVSCTVSYRCFTSPLYRYARSHKAQRACDHCDILDGPTRPSSPLACLFVCALFPSVDLDPSTPGLVPELPVPDLAPVPGIRRKGQAQTPVPVPVEVLKSWNFFITRYF